ncbi:hypothetical protein NPIL_390501 [Nephila pilipes]|uniref:Uncharacterized protein n=1 Tax=Nephila pilipes TaxID=299642 RepID=A0A8X6NGQ5_NEPPI|nr:hypothetical protein NPIL_390501 [Nephila pilipes]
MIIHAAVGKTDMKSIIPWRCSRLTNLDPIKSPPRIVEIASLARSVIHQEMGVRHQFPIFYDVPKLHFLFCPQDPELTNWNVHIWRDIFEKEKEREKKRRVCVMENCDREPQTQNSIRLNPVGLSVK